MTIPETDYTVHLISVYSKEGLDPIVEKLHELGISHLSPQEAPRNLLLTSVYRLLPWKISPPILPSWVDG